MLTLECAVQSLSELPQMWTPGHPPPPTEALSERLLEGGAGGSTFGNRPGVEPSVSGAGGLGSPLQVEEWTFVLKENSPLRRRRVLSCK